MSHPTATTIRRTLVEVPSASLGPESRLPAFTPVRALPTAPMADSATPAMRERAAYGRLTSPLPYALQSDYDRQPRPTPVPAIAIDNGLLRVVVLPGFGGRIWSMRDLVGQRDLVFVNPVLMFANFGLTDAWFAGGIEWNLGSTGHSAMSNRPMHAGLVSTPDGDVLRLWEWERTRDLILQVDLFLAPGSDRLQVSTRVRNPDPEDKPLYYWTNVAVVETAGTRVLAGADAAYRTDYSGSLRRVAVPHPDDPTLDVSRPAASQHAADYFYDVEAQARRHVAAVEPDGRGLAQAATSALVGRKLFLWGHGPGGRRWQEWLCGPDARYAEIQAGVTPTQLEHERLAGGAHLDWTESFGAIDAGPASQGTYDDAVAAVRTAVEATASSLDEVHARWRRDVADQPVREILAQGSGWGQVELELRDQAPHDSLPFPEVDDASAPMRALLRGDLPAMERTIGRLPVPPVSNRWNDVYADSPRHWWVDYAQGVVAQLRGEVRPAESAYRRSLDARRTPEALRCLALLTDDAGSRVAAYAEARVLAPDDRALATEHLALLLDLGRAEECLRVIADLPRRLRGHGRTRLIEARALVATDRHTDAEGVLRGLVVEDLAEGETALTDLWASIHADRPLPPELDFRMTEPAERGDVRVT